MQFIDLIVVFESYFCKYSQNFLFKVQISIFSHTTIYRQECIPVGCVPRTAVAICWGVLPQCMLGYTLPGLGLDTPRCGPGDPPCCGSGDPPGVGLIPPGQTPQLPPYVLAWRPPCGQTDTSKNITVSNFVYGQ